MATSGENLTAPSRLGRRVIGGVKIVSARLRFLVVFGLVFAVIGGWETIRTYWARWTSSATTAASTSSDTDFFCPMDPGVLSDWPSKCPICNMTLVRRKRGDATPLPDGVVARMQFTPYRLWLGGIQTAIVDYTPLSHTIEAPGIVSSINGGVARIDAEIFAGESKWITPGQLAEVSRLDVPGRSSIKAKVHDLTPEQAETRIERVAIKTSGDSAGFHIGDRVRVNISCPVESVEPFRRMPSTPPALVANEPRYLYLCMDHADVVRDAPGRCPKDQSELMGRSLRINQRIRWWCPMHPSVTSERRGAKCDECGGMVLVPRKISFRLPGTVLSLPASAVIDDGSRSLVYVERGPGMFDATVVTLGARCGDTFPVIAGLEPGDLVAAQGTFLIDAETRLNPSLAANYFGAGERPHVHHPAGKVGDWTDGLSMNDRVTALKQQNCPVTGKPLGSMGVPTKVDIKGRTVFLCCDGCTSAIEANPDRYLTKLPLTTEGDRP